jgi:hypothetical protein
MERDGLIVRQPDPADARRARVHLTTHARSLQAPLFRAARHVNKQTTAGLSAAEQKQFVRLLQGAIAALGSSGVGQRRGRRPRKATRRERASDALANGAQLG